MDLGVNVPGNAFRKSDFCVVPEQFAFHPFLCLQAYKIFILVKYSIHEFVQGL
jgi:hypothetical protein